MAPRRSDFESALIARLWAAQGAGLEWLDVQAGDLHREVGDYPGDHRMPVCCGVMRAAMNADDHLVYAPASGVGPRLTVRYRLPRSMSVQKRTSAAQPVSTTGTVLLNSLGPASASRFVLPSPNAVALVSCVKSKRSTPALAADLYTSTLFRLSRRFVEQLGIPWFILSAQYGLLEPGAQIAPYERTLKRMTVVERREWGLRVTQQLAVVLPPDAAVVFLAGVAYQAPLAAALAQRGHQLLDPMAGLGMGKRISWLKSQVTHSGE